MPFDDIMQSALALINNAIILLAVIFLYAATNYDTETRQLSKKITAGIVIGLSAIFIMSNPWELTDGLFFDTRSVLFGISGVFFGAIPTIISGIIGSAFRIHLGGAGVYAGVSTIILTSAAGLLFRYFNTKQYIKSNYLYYYILGFIFHVLTLIAFLLTPNPYDTISRTFPTYLGIFPIITMIVGVVVENQKHRLFLNVEIKRQRTLLTSSIDSLVTMEMYGLDNNFRYLFFNEYHANQMFAFYGVKIHIGDDFLALIEHPQMRLRLQRSLIKVLKGDILKEVVEVESNLGKYIEERFAPIYESENIIGITVFSYEVTERQKYEASILYLSYNDALTGLNNRRFFQEEVKRLYQLNPNIVSVIQVDINGLKIMNDAFGHEAGDKLIIEVTNILKTIFSLKGTICRVGGDEFIILMPNVPYQEASYLIEKAKQVLDKRTINGMSASISFGVSTKTETDDLNETIRLAEDQMYKHKLFETSSHRNESIKTILNTLHEKNPREENHSKRVSELCNLIGKKLKMTNNELSQLKAISNLHDIGKIAIDDRILNKPGKLTEDEWEIIKRHPEIGYRIISTSPEYAEIAYDILSHHEKYDGTGYPRGLKGDQIPIRARIIAIADAYDAMISRRPYREPMSVQDAVNEIKRCKGSQFDPKLVDIFLNIIEK